MTLSDLHRLLERASGVRCACVGDLMVDAYVHGAVDRISPEAPIPVFIHGRSEIMLGAAGNVARNLAALGAKVGLVGLVGGDAVAHDAARLIEQESAIEGHLVAEPERLTTLKTRYVAGGQQLLRVDAEHTDAVSPEGEAKLKSAVADVAEGAGAILISDYAKGVASAGVIEACLAAAEASGAPVVVDPKGRSFAKYGAVRVIKPNARELALTTGLPTGSDEEVEAALAAALADCTADAIVVTRAGAGMSLAERGHPVRHFKAAARQVFDVSGAGDTALAALGLALALGEDLGCAVELAILASGVVVGKAGAAVVTPAELIEAELSAHAASGDAKIEASADALATIARWRAAGLKIGFTNGCFDILHRGHVAYLAEARRACDRLVVGLNTDGSVRGLKGEGRPVNDLESRALVLAGLSSVDLVVPFDDPTPIALIERIRPDVLLKGADYTLDQVVGADFVQGYGGQVKLVPLVEGHSTTATIARMAGRA